mgnify:FL=1
MKSIELMKEWLKGGAVSGAEGCRLLRAYGEETKRGYLGYACNELQKQGVEEVVPEVLGRLV